MPYVNSITRKERKLYYNLKELSYRDWTRAMVQKLLGAPDRTAPSAYRNDQHLYLIKRCISAEKEFKRLWKLSDERISKLGKTIEARNARLLAESKKWNLIVPKLSLTALTKLAQAEHNRTWGAMAEILKGSRLHSYIFSILYQKTLPIELEKIPVACRKSMKDSLYGRIKKAVYKAYPWLIKTRD